MNELFMRVALEQADIAASMDEIPVGAVIVRADEIIATAHNRRRIDRDPTAHAEILALRAAGEALGDWRLDGCELYVTLEPCQMCASAIGMARIDHVWYGAPDVKQGCCGSVLSLTDEARLGVSTPSTGGILAEECAERLSKFMSALRKAKGNV